MRLVSTRDAFTPGATSAILTLDGKDGFFVCEDTDRGLDRSMTIAELKARKVSKLTAIPATNNGPPYRLGIRWSPKLEREVLYLRDVPGYTPNTILLHTGANVTHTDGCQIIGTKRDLATMTIGHSGAAVTWIESEIMPRVRRGEDVSYAIVRRPDAWAAFLRAGGAG